MKILLDECTPHVLKKLLTGFEIKTVQDQGWSGVTNGALLRLAEEHFDVFITAIRILGTNRISQDDNWLSFNCQPTKFP